MPTNTLDFTQSDEFRKKFGSIIRCSAAGFSSGVKLSLLETHPLLNNSAGLLMTSPIDGSYLEPDRVAVPRSNDLAEALSNTLEKYDQIREPSMLLPTTLESNLEKNQSEYLRSLSYGKDEKIMKKLLNLVYPLDDPDRISLESGRSGSESNSPSNTLLDPRLKHGATTRQQSESTTGRRDSSSVKPRPKLNTNIDNTFVDESDDEDRKPQSGKRLSRSQEGSNKGFFSRNTPERLSSLWKKGVLGADEKLRGAWKKHSASSSRSASREGDLHRLPSKERQNSIKEDSSSSSSTKEDEKKEVKKDNIKEDSAAASVVVATSPEGVGRCTVISGDPLGALALSPGNNSTTSSSQTVNKPPIPPANVSSTNSPRRSSSSKVGRSNTFSSQSSPEKKKTSSLLEVGNQEDMPSKSLSSSNLFSEPFSGQEFKTSPSVKQKTNLEVLSFATDDSNWVPPFKLPISGTTTLELASSVASQGLKQATKHIETIRTHYIDPAMMEFANQSNFNARRNELISGSLSSMRSAVTSLSKKYNIIREAMIATPPKSQQNWKPDEVEEDMIDGFWGRRESYDAGLNQPDEASSSNLAGDTDSSSASGQNQDARPDRSLPSSWILSGPFCLGIWITSCSRCHNCKGLLYDEEIMAGWRPDDSNLNTKCWHCKKVTVPLLTISLYYLRHLPKSPPKSAFPTKDEMASEDLDTKTPYSPRKTSRRKTKEEIAEGIQKEGKRLEPLTVPYLSPLVLRKELETMLGHDGENCLTEASFPHHHPILYWNLLWYFSRLRLPSHLSGLGLSTLSHFNDLPIHETWKEADWRNVFVKCLWDNPLYHNETGAPLYVQLKQNLKTSPLVDALLPERANVSKDVLDSYLTLLHFNKVDRCLALMVQCLKKKPSELKYSHYPLYRDLFFFALTAIPISELNTNLFEQEFRREFDKLLHSNKLVTEADGPPPIPSIFCRKYFWDLSL